MLERKELNRQLFHLTSGIAIVLLVYYNLIGVATIAVLFCIGLFASIYATNHKIPGVDWLLRNMEREKDLKILPGVGAVMLLGGALLALLLFDKNIALASITILAVGDSVSPIIGSSIGRIRHPFNKERFIEGTIAGIIMSAVCCLLFVGLGPAVIASTIAMAIESLELKFYGETIDDNLLIPVIAGVILSFI